MDYAKLIKGELSFAPESITIDKTTYIPPTDEAYRIAGYKPVKYTSMPTDRNKYESHFEENNYEIYQVWSEVPMTPAEKREYAYETLAICPWQNELHTVDFMNDLWSKYSAEASSAAEDISVIIAEAKATIRSRYPDENQNEK